LQAFWDGDPERGYAMCAEGALWTFQRSLPYPRTAPIPEALEHLNSTLITGFDDDSGYSIEVHNAIDDGGEEAAIEYSARGKTKAGPMYENDYLVRMTVRDGKVHSVRPYFDTHRVHRVLYDLDQND
jgi:ketosteroid isomerase-like protein